MPRLLIVITLGFILGIVWQACFNIQAFFLVSSGLIVISLEWLIVRKFGYRKETRKIIFASIIFVIATWLGFGNYWWQNRTGKDVLHIMPGKEYQIKGQIITEPEVIQNYTTFLIKIKQIETKFGQTLNINRFLKIKVIDEQLFDGHYGDEIELKTHLYLPRKNTVPGIFDYAGYWQYKKILAAVTIKDINNIKILDYNPTFLWQKLIVNLRNKFASLSTISLSSPDKEVVLGVLIGQRSELSQDIQEMFSNTGVVHILSVSGLHVGIVAGFFFFILRSFRIPKKFSCILTIIIVVIYTLMVGAPPSAKRAALMVIIAMIGVILERDKDWLNTLSLACLLILIFNPNELFDIGFQLSFGATLGILLFIKPLERIFTFLPKFMATSLAVSVAAQITVTPLVAYYFHKFSMVSPIANLIVVPVVALLTFIGFGAFLGGLLFTPLSIFLNQINHFLIVLLLSIVKFLEKWPWSFLYVGTPSLIFIGVWYILLMEIATIKNLISRRLFLITIIIIPIFYLLAGMAKKDYLQVTFLDVGQGDAVCLRLPDGKNMLIDGGGSLAANFNIGERTVEPYLANQGINSIEIVVLTHPHYNHLQGLLPVLEKFKVKQVIMPEPELESFRQDYFLDFLKIIRKKKIYLVFWQGGERIIFDKNIFVQNLTLIRDKETTDSFRDEANLDRQSLVLYLRYDQNGFLLTSDGDLLDILREENKNLKIDVLQIPRHGKKTLATELLTRLRPQYLVVSTKQKDLSFKNIYQNHLFSTARDGSVVFKSSGKTIQVQTYSD